MKFLDQNTKLKCREKKPFKKTQCENSMWKAMGLFVCLKKAYVCFAFTHIKKSVFNTTAKLKSLSNLEMQILFKKLAKLPCRENFLP